MKNIMPLVASLCLATSLIAQDEAQVRAKPDKVPYAVEMLGFTNAFRGSSFFGESYVFRYRISNGENIAGVKKDSLIVTKFEAKDGTDISRTWWGKPRLSYTHTSEKSAFFDVQVMHNKISLSEVPTIEGTITLDIGEGQETKTVTLKTDDRQTHALGTHRISLVHTKDGELGKFGVKVMEPGNTVVSCSIMTDSQCLVSRKILKTASSYSLLSLLLNTSVPVTIYYFDEMPDTEEVTVNLTLWKNLKEHTVSF